jgi:pSer/pThr/pTyr-binding forkhead associated (FHA) protein
MPRNQEPEPTRLESAEEILKAVEARKARKAQKEKAPPPRPAAGAMPATQPHIPAEAKRERPTQRPPMALVCVLDDGSSDGEWVRLRGERTVFGRSSGDVRVPHDGQISGEHAEIVREWTQSGWRWQLRDLGSTNGTFVRVGATVLKHEFELLIGQGRFRFESAGAAAGTPTAPEQSTAAGGTQMAQPFAAAGARILVASLVEVTPAGPVQRIQLTRPEYWIGREPGEGGIVRPEDVFLEAQHARLYRDKSGQWHIANNGSLNGLWLRVKHIGLEKSCQFRLGEQRFLFRRP